MPNAKIEVIHMQPENTNSVLVSDGGAAVIFDPWGSAADWEKLLHEKNLSLIAAYATHAHYDHISAMAGLNVPWHLNEKDFPLIEWSNNFLQDKITKMPRAMGQGEIEILPGIFATAVHLPGHSAGGMGFLISPTQENLCQQAGKIFYPAPESGGRKNIESVGDKNLVFITGDTLFRDSVGRWDLPGGSQAELQESIRKIRNMNLPDNTLVISGHGPAAKLSDIKMENHFYKNW